MFRFVQSLEGRCLFSATPVTKETLLADAAMVAADAAAAKADLKVLSATLAADTKAILADLKGLPKTNAPLFKTLKKDAVHLLATVTKDLAGFAGPTNALAKRSAVTGVQFMTRWTAAAQAKVTADLAALSTVTTAPAAKLEADFQGATLDADLQALVDANPSSTTLSADVARASNDMETKGQVFSDALVKFQDDLDTLASDLAAAPAGPSGGGGKALPQLVGTFSGSYTVTSGNHVGRVTAFTVQIASEAADGSIAGMISLSVSGQVASVSFSGTVTNAGEFTTTFVNESGNSTTLTGTVVAGSVITGTYNTPNDSSGTFTLSK